MCACELQLRITSSGDCRELDSLCLYFHPFQDYVHKATIFTINILNEEETSISIKFELDLKYIYCL